MPSNHRCSKCGAEATHKFTRIANGGQIYDIFLCQEHAAETSPYQKPMNNLSEILEGLLKQDVQFKSAPATPAPPSGLRCHSCGITFESYRKSLILGCSECYSAFRELLAADLRKFHGAIRHVGRRPGGGKVLIPADESARPLSEAEKRADETPSAGAALSKQRLQSMLDELEQKLKHAVQAEDFDKAAHFRDLIRELRIKSQTPASKAQPSSQP